MCGVRMNVGQAGQLGLERVSLALGLVGEHVDGRAGDVAAEDV